MQAGVVHAVQMNGFEPLPRSQGGLGRPLIESVGEEDRARTDR
jgi:hypothetical protein